MASQVFFNHFYLPRLYPNSHSSQSLLHVKFHCVSTAMKTISLFYINAFIFNLYHLFHSRNVPSRRTDTVSAWAKKVHRFDCLCVFFFFVFHFNLLVLFTSLILFSRVQFNFSVFYHYNFFFCFCFDVIPAILKCMVF